MSASDRPLRRIAAIALFAMLWLALAPAVSHALSTVRGESPWTQICTGDATRHSAPSPGEPEGSPVHQVFDHCPLCGLQPMAALPSAPLLLPGGQGLHETPSLFLQAPSTLMAWRHALSRGPPSFS